MKPIPRETGFLLPNESLSDRQLWFRSMFTCENCVYDGTGFKLCEFHERGKELMLK
jgi:hypothetical protein